MKTAHFTLLTISYVTLVTLVSVLILILHGQFNSQSAKAAPTFSAGNIIDNSTMQNESAMSVSQIQRFLDSKGENCSGDLCLKNYSQNGRSAARIIHDVAQAYDINPQVFIVTLQKEVGLITSTSPQSWMYRTAMGFGCPDSTPGECNSQYYGFTNQLKSAGNFFRAHLTNNPNWYKPHLPGWNKILYNPNSNCGTKSVYIENRATSALYSYTPYVPNKSALDAGYGTGDSCSAYGNRNFHLYFNSWFGSPFDKSVKLTRSLYFSPGSTVISQGDNTAVSFIIENTSKTTQTLSSIGVAVRDENNTNLNYPFRSVTLKPGQSYTYYERQVFDEPGKYQMWIANKMDDGRWSTTWPNSSKSNISRTKTIAVSGLPDISISRSLYYSPKANPSYASTEDVTATSFKVKNNESSEVTLPEMRVIAEHTDGSIQYYPSIKNQTLSPSQELTYYKYQTLSKSGSYTLQIQSKLPSGKWTSTWPVVATASTATVKDIKIISPPDVAFSRSLYVSPNPILVGQNIGSSFTIKNYQSTAVTVKELRVRAEDNSGRILDFPSVTNISLEPNEEYTYYQYRKFDKIDKYTFYPVAKVATNKLTKTWPTNKNFAVKRTYNSVLPDLSLSRSMYFSPGSLRPSVNQQTAVSFKVRNNEDRSIVVPTMVVAVRDQNNNVIDYPYERDVLLEAGKSHEYYQYKVFNKIGKHRLRILLERPDGGWSTTWPHSSNDTYIRNKDIVVH